MGPKSVKLYQEVLGATGEALFCGKLMGSTIILKGTTVDGSTESRLNSNGLGYFNQ
jgi:hypothetical protein